VEQDLKHRPEQLKLIKNIKVLIVLVKPQEIFLVILKLVHLSVNIFLFHGTIVLMEIVYQLI
jgi:hypothetical protein